MDYNIPRELKVLLDKNTDLFVQNANQFFSKINVKYFSDRKNIELVNKLLEKYPTNKHGIIDLGDYVIRYIKICGDGVENSTYLNKSMCNESKQGDRIYIIPNSLTKKSTVLIPNYLSKNIISLLMILIKPYTPVFCETYGMVYDRKKNNIFLAMEKLRPSFSMVREEVFRFIYTVFQVVHGLDIAQKTGRYVNFDLRVNKLLKRDNDKINIFQIGNNYVYTYFDFIPVIKNSEMTRLETDKYIVTPKNRVSQYVDIVNYYEYNPYYDLYVFLHSLTMELGVTLDPIHGMVTSPVSELANAMFSLFLRLDNPKDISKAVKYYSLDAHRPNPSKLINKPPAPPSTFKNAMLNRFVNDYQQGSVNVAKSVVENYLKIRGFVISNTFYDLENSVTFMDVSIPKDIPLSSKITSYDSFDKIEIKSSIVKSSYLANGKLIPIKYYTHIATMSQNSQDYRFRFDCCRTNMKNIFEKKNISSGVSINASFFNIRKDFSPIGIYKSPSISGDFNPIPKEFKDSYGFIVVEEGVLKILKHMDDINKYEYILTVGPILIWEKEILITRDILENDKYQKDDTSILKYGCTKPTSDSENTKEFLTKKSKKKFTRKKRKEAIKNCNMIKPGELSHLSSLNPRSALGVDDNSNVYFIYIEGRGARGDGVDASQLAYLCKEIGCTRAINMDGGVSSQLMWMNPKERVIHQPNPYHDFTYPVGTIISFVKQK